MAKKIQEELSRHCGLSLEKSKVADICFAFNNREMLLLLKKRSEYLGKARFDKAEEVENQLTALKNEKYEELIIPNTFFCTF